MSEILGTQRAGVPDHLVERLQCGAESAYEELISRFEQPIYNLVSRLLNNPDGACDVVQEVFLKVFRNIGSFRGESSLKTWIYRIAVHEAYNHRRWFNRHSKMEVGLETYEEGLRNYSDVLPDPGRTPYDQALNQERHALIETALQDLNPIFRNAVILRDMEDLSYEEIAEILQVSLGTVKSRILRGREGLRRSLESRLSDGAGSLGWAAQIAE
jgi:RNA polymerase sigma-70 factor (ECF subfamily)